MRAVTHVGVVGIFCLGLVGCQVASDVNPVAPRVLADGESAPRLHLAGSPRFAEGDIVKACFLITMDDSDSRNAVIGTIRGAGSVFDLIEGVDPEPGSNPPIYNGYILKRSLLPVGTPDIRVEGGVMINTDVPAVVRNEYSQDTTLWWTIIIGGGQNPTRSEMQTRLRNEAYVNRNCSHYWQIVPGDSLSVAAAGQPGDLLSKFLPLP